MLGGHAGLLVVQPRISTSHSAWLLHEAGRKTKMMKGMWHLKAAQPSGSGAENRAPQDTSHAWGLQTDENPPRI